MPRALRSAWLLVALAGCSGTGTPDAPGPSRSHPVVIVGVDGFEWDVILPLLEAGRLPNLAGLMARGRYGELATFRPNSSPVLWTSAATGMQPAKHGILDFVHGDEERLYTNLDRTTKAFWNIATDAGRRSAIVGWWLTYPVEAIDGVMVAQTNTLPDDADVGDDKLWKGVLVEDLPGQVHPPELQDEILAIVPQVESGMAELTRSLFGALPDPPDAVAAKLWEACAWSLRGDEIYRRVALRLLGEQPPFDLFAVYIGGTDVLGHRFWRYTFPQHYEHPPGEAEIAAYGRLIPDYYAHVDRLIGELLAASPADANVLVLSDHGMTATRRALDYDTEAPVRSLRSGGHRHAPPGVLVAAGPDVRAPDPALAQGTPRRDRLTVVGSMLDVTPTILALLGIPLGRDMDGSVMAAVTAVEPVGWVDSHTPAGWFAARARTVETPMAAERLEQLRSLGYIGGGDGDDGD